MADPPASSAQLWRLNQCGLLRLASGAERQEPITREQARGLIAAELKRLGLHAFPGTRAAQRDG
jgi:hypothetical protein